MTKKLSKEDPKKYILQAKQELQEKVKAIKDSFFDNPSGVGSVQAYTRLIDDTIVSIYKTFSDEYFAENRDAVSSLCLIAIGGYGRGELNIFSDIDLLFLYEKKADSFVDHITGKMVAFLWDIGLEVGHSYRSIKYCLTISRGDIVSFTSLLESRLLAGNGKIYSQFQSVLKKYLRQRETHRFIFQHVDNTNNVEKKNISVIFVSEPDIKESPGGLRDIHSALWATRIVFGTGALEELKKKNIIDIGEYNALKSSLELVLKIRNALHICTEKKSDILAHEVQKKIAEWLGYYSNNERSGIEVLMRDYYSAAYNIHILSHILIQRCLGYKKQTQSFFKSFRTKELGKGLVQYKDELSFKDFNETVFVDGPDLLFDVFLVAQKLDLKLSENLKRLIRKNIPLLKEVKWHSGDLKDFFITLMKAGNTSRVLRSMHEVDVLGLFLPEFGKCKFQIHNDFFHMHTVDEHCIQAVEKLESLYMSDQKELSEILSVYKSIRKPEILKLSLLLHDIGKAEGTDHIETGLAYLNNIINRLDLEKEDSEILVFLIKNHLLMNHIAQRRDLSDRNTIEEVAEKIKDIKLLKLLYLHTCADVMAVAPTMWTEWKGALLWELYHKTYDYLIVDDSVRTEDQEIASNCKKDVVALLPKENNNEDFLRHYLDNMPVKYFVSLNPEEIARHISLVRQLDNKIVEVDCSKNSELGFWELLVCTKGKVGTLAKITGILCSRGLNILSAQVFSGKDGIAIDTLQITRSGFNNIEEADLFQKIEKDLEDVLSGKKEINDIVKSRRLTNKNNLKKDVLIPTTVLADNNISKNYTVFELIFQDRVGPLYFITKVFSDLEVNIINAKISTQGKRGLDVFYVTDLNGKKILDKKRLETIKSSLIKSLGSNT